MADKRPEAFYDFKWDGYSEKSYNPGYPEEMNKSLGQPRGETFTVDDVKRGYKPQ